MFQSEDLTLLAEVSYIVLYPGGSEPPPYGIGRGRFVNRPYAAYMQKTTPFGVVFLIYGWFSSHFTAHSA